MRILLTNDDGIHAPGLAVLERIAAELSDDVWVVAPEFDQSGLSHSLSLNDPLRLREIGEKRFALRGTPSDCVIMAVRRLLGGKPDLVLSGVNSGENVADDVTYSGTIAGAIEGTLLGAPSIALSQALFLRRRRADRAVADGGEPGAGHHPQAPRLRLSEGRVLQRQLPEPAGRRTYAGVAVTAQGELTHGLHIDERRDGRNLQYFWLTYRREKSEPMPGSDNEALESGHDLGDAAPPRHDGDTS